MATDSRAGRAGQEWRRVTRLARPRAARNFALAVDDGVRRNDLFTSASAISYQLLFALVPAALAGLALLGFLDLEEIWSDRLAPQARDRLSDPAFQVVDGTVEQILGRQRGFWLTFGVAFALWQVSGTVRAAMGALNRVYEAEEERGLVHRVALSLGLATAVSLLVVVALATIHLGERVVGPFRWPLAAVVLLTLVGVIVRFAPASPQPVAWVGFGSVLVVVAWLLASAGFGFYATSIASYGSIFGSLGVAIVLMTYVYLSAIVFLVGVQVDVLVRQQAAGIRER